jgi:hypothetical protein
VVSILIRACLTYITLVVLVLLLCNLPIVSTSSDLDGDVGSLVERASELYSKGIDISIIIEKLNNAIVSYEEGNVNESSRLLGEARGLIENMSTIAYSVYFSNIVFKAIIVVLLATIPVLVYTLLPRFYLYLWYRSRKKWIVLR